MTLLLAAHIPEIRSLIDTHITEEELPDALVQQDVFWGEADRAVERTLGTATYAALSGDNLISATNAAKLFCAAFIARSTPNITTLWVDDYREERPVMRPEVRAAELESRARQLLSLISTAQRTSRRTHRFGLGQTGRTW